MTQKRDRFLRGRGARECFFADPEWTVAFLGDFNDRYRDALWNYESGRFDRVPEAWRVAFGTRNDPSVGVFTHALLGIHAHINHDLPFTIAAVVPPDDREARYADLLVTNEFLLAAVDLIEKVVAQYDPFLAVVDEAMGRVDEYLLEWTSTFLSGR